MPFPRLLVFDLDGTLIDSEQDLTDAVNATLAECGLDALPASLIRTYIGDGAAMLVRRALGSVPGTQVDDAQLACALEFFLQHYHVHKLDHTRLYPGVIEALARIREAYPGTLMAVLTNKPVHASREICFGLGIAPFFRWCIGGNTFPVKKPDPTGLLHLMRSAAVQDQADERTTRERRDVVMIGDSAVDLATAASAGVASVACTYGLTPPQTLMALHPTAVAESPLAWQEVCEAIGAGATQAT